MPEIGEIRRGKEIGKNYNGRFMWVACPVCKKERWITFINGKPKWQRCLACANHTKLEERQLLKYNLMIFSIQWQHAMVMF